MNTSRLALSIFVLATLPLSAQQRNRPPMQALLDARTRIRDVVSRWLADAEAGKPRDIRVGDVAIPPARFRRQAVYAIASSIVDTKCMEILADQSAAAQLAGGRDPADFAEPVDPEPPPAADAEERLRRWQQQQNQRFERVFMSGAPDAWPEASRDAVKASAGDQGEAFWKNLQKAAAGGGLPPFWMQLVRGWVLKHLTATTVRYPADGLPDDVALRVGDRDWSTADAFALVRAYVSPEVLERAVTTVIVHEALQQALIADGHWVSDVEFRAAFAAYREPLDKTPFTVEVMAKSFKGFPSLEIYRQHWRLVHAFEPSLGAIDDEAVRAHREAYFAETTAVVELIPFLAQDPATGRWRLDGVARAQRAAIAAFEEIGAGRPFATLRRDRGQFAPDDEFQGLFEGCSLEHLRGQLGENEFTDLVSGFSVAEHLFFDADLDTPSAPLPGPRGYYLASIRQRDVRPAKSGAAKATREHLVHKRFCDWADTVLLRTTIR